MGLLRSSWSTLMCRLSLFICRRRPRSQSTDTRFPYATLFRSGVGDGIGRIRAELAGTGKRIPHLLAACTERVCQLLRVEVQFRASRQEVDRKGTRLNSSQ